MSDEEADNIFMRNILALVQLGVFSIAAMLLIAVYAYSQQETVCEKNEVQAESGSGSGSGNSERLAEKIH